VIRQGLIVAYGEHGRGVFTLLPIKKGEIIEVAPSIELPVTGMNDYVYAGQNEGLSRIVFGYGMLYAHSSDPNTEVDHGATCSTFLATRDIEAGQELTHDYGAEWWETRGLEPR
jgi:SET domain-containing protein